MSTDQPGLGQLAVDIGVEVGRFVGALALTFSVIAPLAWIGDYTRLNAEQCGGGLGRLGTGIGVYVMLALALLFALLTLVVTLAVAITSRRWAWIAGLVAVAAVAVLLTVDTDTWVSRTLLGSILGFGCATTDAEAALIARCFAPLLVAVPCFVCLMTGRRQEY